MKKLYVLAISTALVGLLAGCQSTDVVGKVAGTSFEKLIVSQTSAVKADDANGGWSLTSPGNEQFVWSKDLSQSGKPDLMMAFDASPFLNAGLDPEKLNKEMYIYEADTKILMIHSELGAEAFTYNGEATPIESFKQIVKTHRDRIGYHEVLDHYGVGFGEGNMFEWAKDMTTNDKDMVFVLNPKAFIEAGVDPTQVKDWIFTKVEIVNDQGEKEEVDKFLKPYSLD